MCVMEYVAIDSFIGEDSFVLFIIVHRSQLRLCGERCVRSRISFVCHFIVVFFFLGFSNGLNYSWHFMYYTLSAEANYVAFSV